MFVTTLVLCCLKKLLGEIIPEDGVKCPLFPVIPSSGPGESAAAPVLYRND